MRTRSGPVHAPGLCVQRALRGQRGGERVRCAGEDRVDAIADRLEHDPAGRGDDLLQDGVVARRAPGHRLRMRSHSCVLPSMSVNRKVRVPAGRAGGAARTGDRTRSRASAGGTAGGEAAGAAAAASVVAAWMSRSRVRSCALPRYTR